MANKKRKRQANIKKTQCSACNRTMGQHTANCPVSTSLDIEH